MYGLFDALVESIVVLLYCFPYLHIRKALLFEVVNLKLIFINKSQAKLKIKLKLVSLQLMKNKRLSETWMKRN